jgi:acetyl/propionyl-CoA carboxylase alpha subunit
VAKGDPLLSMEAMKMETMLSAERDAVVHAIHVRTGETVNAKEFLKNWDMTTTWRARCWPAWPCACIN